MMKFRVATRDKVRIGWMRDAAEAAAVYYPPEKLVVFGHRMSGQARCPATQDYRRNRFLIRAPFDIELRVQEERVELAKREGDGALKHSKVTVEDRSRWYNPDRPIIQLNLPYAFVSDVPGVRLRTTPPFEWYEARYPGVMVAGDFDIYDWPLRHINWAFEWWDTSAPLRIRRGTPLFCVEFPNVDGLVELVELYATPEIGAVMRSTTSVTGYVERGTRELMRLFGRTRPKRIIPLGYLRG